MAEALNELDELRLMDYFEVVSPDEILIRGTRVGIETVIEETKRGLSPEEIAVAYPSLTLDQIHATLTVYHRRREEIDAYMQRWAEHGEQMLAEQKRNAPEFVERLCRALYRVGGAEQ